MPETPTPGAAAATAPERGDRLAAFGGTPAVPPALRSFDWPLVTDADRAAVLSTLDSGTLVADVDGETAVSALERRWAAHCGTPHCLATSNGTTALAVALAALGIGPGDEVVVPALSFIASGLAPLHQMAVPVFADVDPVSFTLDPASVESVLSARTAAILPVHLHGQPADMDAVGRIAERHGLAVIEDAAQAHGARWGERPVGSLGDAGAFSLQVTKNLPTCGEGGLLTVSDPDVAKRARMIGQFGEVVTPGKARDYVSYLLGWNHKMNAVQAAFTLSQLDRFDDYVAARHSNVTAFLDRLTDLPGLLPPRGTPGSTHAWHILRFRLDPRAAGLDGVSPGAFRRVVHRLLRAEGVPMSRYQVLTLPQQKVFTDRIGFGSGHPWAASAEPPYADTPVASAVVEDSLTLQKRHLHPDAGPALQRYADGIEKVWNNMDLVATMAAAR